MSEEYNKSVAEQRKLVQELSPSLAFIRYEKPEYAKQIRNQMKRARAVVRKTGKRNKKYSTILKAALSLVYNTDPDLEPELHGLNYMEVIIMRVVERAARTGDVTQFEKLMDRLEGKPAQKIESTKVELPYHEFLANEAKTITADMITEEDLEQELFGGSQRDGTDQLGSPSVPRELPVLQRTGAEDSKQRR